MSKVEWKPGKFLDVNISQRAHKALNKLGTPIYVELELYFSCLIRKRVLVSTQKVESRKYISPYERVNVTFSPVMTKACEINPNQTPELVEFPIKKPDAYLPKWLTLDYRQNEFIGEFGY